jgi:hypothetical protein
MEKFAINYSSLDEHVNSPKRYLLADVKHRIKKVAFDVVRFMDGSDIDGLWQIKKTEDGQEYIVAMYDTPQDAEKTSSDWSVFVDKSSNASVFYKGAPVIKLALASMGFSAEEAELVSEDLPQKLNSNVKLASSLLKSVSLPVRSELVKEYPELGKLL